MEGSTGGKRLDGHDGVAPGVQVPSSGVRNKLFGSGWWHSDACKPRLTIACRRMKLRQREAQAIESYKTRKRHFTDDNQESFFCF